MYQLPKTHVTNQNGIKTRTFVEAFHKASLDVALECQAPNSLLANVALLLSLIWSTTCHSKSTD